MPADSISSLSDSELLTICSQVFAVLTAAPAQYGFTAADAVEFGQKRDDFDTDLTAHTAAQADAQAKTAQKNTSRQILEAALRSIRKMAKAVGATEPNMQALGIPESSGKAPANATVPATAVNTSERLRHRLDWTDAANLNNKKKPVGAMGAEIWVKIGDPPPGNEKDCVFLTLDAFTPYVAEYDPADAGKMAHYMIRWRMRDGSVSAWGETVSATITG